jgi:tRNA threonylcarbamoyl adenosine modification protein YeaZ
MTILALEFSSEQRSVAVSRDGVVLDEAIETGGRNTAAFATIERMLAKAKIEREEIEGIAVGLGPGSYTGVRAAIALAQGWQLARDVKVAGVSSVEAIAAGAQAGKFFGLVNVIVNAQREEFYIATYDIGEAALKKTEPLKILPVADIRSRAEKGELFIGPEATKFSLNGLVLFPQAAAVAKLAAARSAFSADEKLEPIYLRETNFVKAQLPR